MKKPVVPVLTEKLLNWMLVTPHQLGLEGAWKLANSQSYLPKRGVHFQSSDEAIQWGEYEFSVKDVAFRVIRKWKPDSDLV